MTSHNSVRISFRDRATGGYPCPAVVLDYGAPYGDAVLPLEGGGAVGGIRGFRAGRQLQSADQVSPVDLSANVPNTDENHTALESRYVGLVRRVA